MICFNQKNSSMHCIGVRFSFVIPVSKARLPAGRQVENPSLSKDSGQAGMTDLIPHRLQWGC
jgi:hypothetical protein